MKFPFFLSKCQKNRKIYTFRREFWRWFSFSHNFQFSIPLLNFLFVIFTTLNLVYTIFFVLLLLNVMLNVAWVLRKKVIINKIVHISILWISICHRASHFRNQLTGNRENGKSEKSSMQVIAQFGFIKRE